ncbi:MAG: Cof-type HAD-IIB family hydrolase [Massiliimalia sp.]|jgi:Cof subfamily protein (haloacid dehalogenase superfamily)
MAQVKLLALDMDGTTLMDDHKTVSQENIRAIEQVMMQGIQFVPATGRMRAHLPEAIRQMPGWRYGITSNGAAVYDRQKDQLIYSHCLNREVTAQILEFLSPMPVFFELYCDGDSYVETRRMRYAAEYGVPPQDMELLLGKCHAVDDLAAYIRQEEIHLEKVYIPYLNPQMNEKIRNYLAGFPVAITSSVDTNIEVNMENTSKGNALAWLCQLLGIDPGEVMAVGDNCNDLEMLELAGISVAMENGDPAVKEIADWVAPSNMKNGVACAIERYLGV